MLSSAEHEIFYNLEPSLCTSLYTIAKGFTDLIKASWEEICLKQKSNHDQGLHCLSF